ncbi:retrotransposon unclassified [Hordeum vulgare]|nr:retrotransposon unclassified [Hordeum vulgare]
MINVISRILAKGYANRVTLLADRIMHPDQSAFIYGRYILDGVLILHETIHEVCSRILKAVFLKLDSHKAYDIVSWDFLRKVLLRKGFDDRWVTRVMQMVSSGRTAININGEIGPYFPTKYGVRQGDPFSPFLFNMVVDALAAILDKAKPAGHIRRIVLHLVGDLGVSLLQYLDDTIIMVEGSDDDISNLKFLLLCFQQMPGLKINLNRSAVMVLGYPPTAAESIADRFNCQLGSFPCHTRGSPLVTPVSRWRIYDLRLASSSIVLNRDTRIHPALVDRWAGESPFAAHFSSLFSIAVVPWISAEEALTDLGRLAFHPPFGPMDTIAWQELLESIALDESDIDRPDDRISWQLGPSGCFSTKSLYRAIAPSQGFEPLSALSETRLPLKIRIFRW